MKYQIVSERIKLALERAHLSQQELSDLSGVNKASISQYVNGSHSPSNLKAGPMAEILKVNPLWLMGFETASMEPETHRNVENINLAYLLDTPKGQLLVELKDIAESLDEGKLEQLVNFAKFLSNNEI